jgi:hypothetical protein
VIVCFRKRRYPAANRPNIIRLDAAPITPQGNPERDLFQGFPGISRPAVLENELMGNQFRPNPNKALN